jgi:hypothetical protein
VVFEVESIDRLYLNLYVPELQRVGQVVGFLTRHLGFEIASTALVARRSEAFVDGIRRYARDHDVPLIDFVTGQRKDDVMHEYLARADGSEQVLFISRAQEKTRVFRTERRRNPTTRVAYPWIVTATAMVNCFYVYAVDEDFGPFFVKFGSYFPYTGRLCINGHEYAKTPGHQGPDRVHRAGQRLCRRRRPRRGTGDLRRSDRRQDRCPAAQVAGPAAPPVHPRRPGRRLPI